MTDPMKLPDMDFSLSGIYVKYEAWESGSVYDYTDRGRTGNLLHYIIDGTRIYEIGGRRQQLRAGSVILLPDGTPYRTEELQRDRDLLRSVSGRRHTACVAAGAVFGG